MLKNNKKHVGAVSIFRDGVRADDTGEKILYYAVCRNNITASYNIEDVLANTETPLELNEEGVSFFLQNGFIPASQTIYKNIFWLSIGDEAHHSVASPSRQTVFTRFPYFRQHSSQQNFYNPEKLLDVLGRAIAERITANKPAFLMLSGGKDSLSLALALSRADLGDAVTGLTYGLEDQRYDESSIAVEAARKLGLKHHVVRLKNGGGELKELLTRFFRQSVFPCADEALIPYLRCMEFIKEDCQHSTAQVIDGSGNDVYMGHIPGKSDVLKFKLAIGDTVDLSELRGLLLRRLKISHLFDTKVETLFPGRRGVPPLLLNQLNSSLNDSSEFWRDLYEENKNLDYFDLRALCRGRHYDQGEVMLKARLATSVFGFDYAFPFCDQDVINYLFHLSEDERFDQVNYLNKIALRKLLRSELQYDDLKIGKKAFYLEGVEVVRNLKDFIFDEVEQCAYWNTNTAKRLLTQCFKSLDQFPGFYRTILILFMLSGW
ncbi:MAG: asparagine synthase, partial [Candidatus Omnitrophica bacterium]|nr:asparagine synthase [Candidatus Omnitrophota bacterium]